jgi:ligand-binding sensor domain-containing protein/two-component sensor histidine kinase
MAIPTTFFERLNQFSTIFRKFSTPFLILCIVTYSTSIQASEPWITSSWVNNILGNTQISTIHIDQRQNLWLGSQNGLYRLSGSEITSFSTSGEADHKIRSGNITDIVEDSQGNIYVSTFNSGVIKIGTTERHADFLADIQLTAQERIESLYVAPDDSLWVIAQGKLSIPHPTAGVAKASKLTSEIYSQIGSVSLLYTLSNESIFVAGDKGVGHIQTDSMSLSPISFPRNVITEGTHITSAAAAENKQLILGTSQGTILLYDLASQEISISASLPTSNLAAISGLCMIGENLMVTTSNGLYLSQKNSPELIDVSQAGQGVSSLDIDSVYCEGDRAWVGTYRGLDLFTFAAFESPGQHSGGVSNDILSIEEDSSGRVWLGTYEGLFFYDPSSDSQSNYNQIPNVLPLLSNRISVLEVYGDNLWIGFVSHTIQRLDTTNLDLFTVENDDRFFTIDLLYRGESLWIGTHGDGLIRYYNNELKKYFETGTLDESTVNLLHELPDGRLLAVAIDTVYLYDDLSDTFTPLELTFQYQSMMPTILSMKNARYGGTLIGTEEHGLFIWNSAENMQKTAMVKILEDSLLLPSQSINSIEIDSQENLWCSTDNGIAQMSPQGLITRVYNQSDGLRGNDFTTGVSLKSSNGKLYFGGPQGYTSIDPNEVANSPDTSTVAILSAIIDGDRMRILSSGESVNSIAVSQGESLTISYGVLDYVDPSKFTYRYRLLDQDVDLDMDWVYVGKKNTVPYNDIQAGEYSFEVEGSNSAGLWGQSAATIAIRVLPSPWKTWWAYTLYLLALAFAIWSIHRIYYSYLMERLSEALTLQVIETENQAEDEIQEQLELHDELAQSAYRHNRNMLSVLEHCLPEAAKESIGRLESTPRGRKYIRALSFLEDCTLYESGGACVDFHLYVESVIDEIMKDCPVDAHTVISVNEVSRSSISVEVASGLAIIVYELAQNSALHAFSPDSPANYLRVISSVENDSDSTGATYTLTVRDNGKGLHKDALDLALPGSGLALAKSVAEKLGAQISISIDKGTAVTIVFAVADLDEIFA